MEKRKNRKERDRTETNRKRTGNENVETKRNWGKKLENKKKKKTGEMICIK